MTTRCNHLSAFSGIPPPAQQSSRKPSVQCDAAERRQPAAVAAVAGLVQVAARPGGAAILEQRRRNCARGRRRAPAHRSRLRGRTRSGIRFTAAPVANRHADISQHAGKAQVRYAGTAGALRLRPWFVRADSRQAPGGSSAGGRSTGWRFPAPDIAAGRGCRCALYFSHGSRAIEIVARVFLARPDQKSPASPGICFARNTAWAMKSTSSRRPKPP